MVHQRAHKKPAIRYFSELVESSSQFRMFSEICFNIITHLRL
jgi:hypothetical protein